MILDKYLITYELRDKTKDRSGLYIAIQSLGAWWHYMDSIWIIKNSVYDVQKIYSILAPHFSIQDYLLIIKIDPTQKNGWLPGDAWTWMDN